MSMYERRHSNPGKRERKAGKRHRRAVIFSYDGAVAVRLKFGRSHGGRVWRRVERARVMTVAESEKRITGAPENC